MWSFPHQHPSVTHCRTLPQLPPFTGNVTSVSVGHHLPLNPEFYIRRRWWKKNISVLSWFRNLSTDDLPQQKIHLESHHIRVWIWRTSLQSQSSWMLQAATSELPSATQIQYIMADVKLPNASPTPCQDAILYYSNCLSSFSYKCKKCLIYLFLVCITVHECYFDRVVII